MHWKHFMSFIESTLTNSPSFEHGSLRPTENDEEKKQQQHIIEY